MKILFVLECANMPTNGTTASCNRFARELLQAGHEIKVIGCEFKDKSKMPKDYPYIEVPFFHFPIFQGMIEKEGFNFVRSNPLDFVDVVQWADLVHIFLPMGFGKVARLVAEAYNKPVTTAFHLQPQNISCALHMGKWRFLNDMIYRGFKNYHYSKIRYVHCPSKMIARELRRHHYNNDISVISNGVIPFFHRIPSNRPKEYEGKMIVMMSGRLASEKRQDLIIKAVGHSKYNDKIQLILCGQGPNEKLYRKLARKVGIKNPIKIQFCTSEELRDIICYTDIYVHASDFEIEGISCLEAIACGAVPVISDSGYSATSDFALTKKSIFRHGSWRSLMHRIDWMYEHPEERAALSPRYEELGKEFALDNMVEKMSNFFQQAYEDHQSETEFVPSKRDLRWIRRVFKKLKKSGAIQELPPILL